MEEIRKIHGIELCGDIADSVFLHDNGEVANISPTGVVLRSVPPIYDGRYRNFLAFHPILSVLLI